MANESNLRRLSTDEARKIGKKGGKASGETRRKKKSMKQAMNLLLSLPVSEKNMETLEQLGINTDDADNQMLVMVSMMQRAIKGNVSAAQFIASVTGSTVMTEAEREKIKLEKKRLKMEEQHMAKVNEEDDNQRTQSQMNAIDGVIEQMKQLDEGDEKT
jgi:hypothetical protein